MKKVIKNQNSKTKCLYCGQTYQPPIDGGEGHCFKGLDEEKHIYLICPKCGYQQVAEVDMYIFSITEGHPYTCTCTHHLELVPDRGRYIDEMFKRAIE